MKPISEMSIQELKEYRSYVAYKIYTYKPSRNNGKTSYIINLYDTIREIDYRLFLYEGSYPNDL